MGGNESTRRYEDRNRDIQEYEKALEARIRLQARELENRRILESRDAASKKDLEKALEEQRKVYEQKIRKIIQEKHGSAVLVTPDRDAASKRDLEKALEEQRKLYEVKMQDLVRNQQREVVAASAPLQLPQAPLHHAVMQQASAQPMQHSYHQAQAAAQQAAAQQMAAQQAAAQQMAAQAATQRAIVEQAVTQQAQQSTSQLSAAEKANIQAIAAESVQKMHNEGFTLRQTLEYSIDRLYPRLDAVKQRTPSPNAGASGAANFKDSLQNVQKTSNSNKNNGEEDITCKTCHRRFGERIYNCQRGHSCCHLCKLQALPCAVCRQHISDVRNYNMETYVAERRVKCQYADDGCRLFIKLSTMAAHVKECPFREMMCPSLGPCNWTGKMNSLMDHFNDKHQCHRQGDVDKEMFLSNLNTQSHTMDFVKIGNFNFLAHVEISAIKQKISFAVQLIGTKHSASKWIYELHIYNKKEPRRKFFFTDRCSSNRDHLNNIIGTANCAVLPMAYAKTFFAEGALAYKYYIKREEVSDNQSDTKENKVRRRPRSRVGKRN